MDYTNLIDKVNIPELVKALRSYSKESTWCASVVWEKLMLNAADAIEALKKTLEAVQKNSGINFRMWEEAQAEVERLQAQLPKRGKWIRIDKHTVQCSLCHRYLDLRGVNAGRGDANYCPNCGADMSAKIETQDESISKFADGEWWKEARK